MKVLVNGEVYELFTVSFYQNTVTKHVAPFTTCGTEVFTNFLRQAEIDK